MLWTERSIKELAAKEVAALLASPTGREAIAGHLPGLLFDPVVKSAALAVMIELLAQDEAKPLAERVTSDVRNILEKLESQTSKAIKSEQKKITEQKLEMIEKAKEEIRLSVIAQKSLTTRQINQHIESHQISITNLIASMESDLAEASREAEARICRRRETLIEDLRSKIQTILNDRLQEFALEAVRRQVRERPVYDPKFTNRELAQANGISIREVKRRRMRRA
jgi:hypothetical protein